MFVAKRRGALRRGKKCDGETKPARNSARVAGFAPPPGRDARGHGRRRTYIEAFRQGGRRKTCCPTRAIRAVVLIGEDGLGVYGGAFKGFRGGLLEKMRVVSGARTPISESASWACDRHELCGLRPVRKWH